MGFDWGDETYKYRVHVVSLADGRYSWRLVITDNAAATSESFEEGEQSFESPQAAEDAGKYRMIELARGTRTKSK